MLRLHAPHFCQDLGWPLLRRRMVAFAWRTAAWAWVGPTDATNIKRVFAKFACRTVVTEGDIFLGDTAANVLKMKHNLVATRKLQANRELDPSLPFEDLFVASQRQHFQQYKDLRQQQIATGLSGCSISDLSQNPTQRLVMSPWLTTLTTSSFKYSHSAERPFTARELLYAHGWPALGGDGVRKMFDVEAIPASRMKATPIHVPKNIRMHQILHSK